MKRHLNIIRVVISALALLAGIIGAAQPAAAGGGGLPPRTASINVDWQF